MSPAPPLKIWSIPFHQKNSLFIAGSAASFFWKHGWKAQHLAQLHHQGRVMAQVWTTTDIPAKRARQTLWENAESLSLLIKMQGSCNNLWANRVTRVILGSKCHQIAVKSTTLWLQQLLQICLTSYALLDPFLYMSPSRLWRVGTWLSHLLESWLIRKKTPPIDRWPPSKQRSPAICLLPMDTSSSLWRQHRFERRSNALAHYSKLVWFTVMICFETVILHHLWQLPSLPPPTTFRTLQPLLSVRKRMNWRRHCSEVGRWSWFPQQRQCSRNRAGWTAWAIQTRKFQTGWRLGALGWQMAARMWDESGLLLQGRPDAARMAGWSPEKNTVA